MGQTSRLCGRQTYESIFLTAPRSPHEDESAARLAGRQTHTDRHKVYTYNNYLTDHFCLFFTLHMAMRERADRKEDRHIQSHTHTHRRIYIQHTISAFSSLSTWLKSSSRGSDNPFTLSLVCRWRLAAAAEPSACSESISLGCPFSSRRP